jgi:hypothetical protein
VVAADLWNVESMICSNGLVFRAGSAAPNE